LAKLLLLLASIYGFPVLHWAPLPSQRVGARPPAENLLGAFRPGVAVPTSGIPAALMGIALLLFRWPEATLFKSAGVLVGAVGNLWPVLPASLYVDGRSTGA